MANLKWLVNRLRVMSFPEVVWRLSQKQLQRRETAQYKQSNILVSEQVFNRKYEKLLFNANAFRLNLENRNYSLNSQIELLGFDYLKYECDWHAGFQTTNNWPQVFSYELDYKQRDDIGDARTNWELNRHFQFAILAKNYYASHERCYLKELQRQTKSWIAHNPFLVGISWTSTMEFAIRSINWMYALAFIDKTDALELKQELAIGVINMIDYVSQHYSRYSSANNHLLVEAAAIGIAGFAFDYEPWREKAIGIMSDELSRQFYSDGVNKELSLHYQIFAMEAYALIMNLMKKNSIAVPAQWVRALRKQCEFVSDCQGKHGETIVFGDDDDGKILDLTGKETDRYAYILQFLSCLLDMRFDSMDCVDETVSWLFSLEEIEQAKKKPLYDNSKHAIYREGGYTILKSPDERVLIGIDHGLLGFGSIAAHGHADALSFQMFVDGNPVLIDPGTYVYHCNLPLRNAFRKTESHNTVVVDGKDQSEILGPFLWGKKAKSTLSEYSENLNGIIRLNTTHDGYLPVTHKRTFEFDGERQLRIIDELQSDAKVSAQAIFCFHESPEIQKIDAQYILRSDLVIIKIIGANAATILPMVYSPRYGVLKEGFKAIVDFDSSISLCSEIEIREG